MKTFTDEQVLEALYASFRERGPEFVYKEAPEVGACTYSDPEEGDPSCIVGMVIYKLDPELFAEVARNEWSDDPSFGVFAIPAGGVLDNIMAISDESIDLLNSAQTHQDAGIRYVDVADLLKLDRKEVFGETA